MYATLAPWAEAAASSVCSMALLAASAPPYRIIIIMCQHDTVGPRGGTLRIYIMDF